jgi:hypothetical protein
VGGAWSAVAFGAEAVEEAGSFRIHTHEASLPANTSLRMALEVTVLIVDWTANVVAMQSDPSPTVKIRLTNIAEGLVFKRTLIE